MAILDLFELDHNDPEKVSIPLNFSSIDYRDIGARKGSFSRTIKLPSTKANDMFFGLNFEVTNEGLFDDKVKIPISINKIEFLGFMQLNGVSIVDGKTDSYSVNIFSDLVDWAALIGVGSIRSLPLGSHQYSMPTIEDSWGNSPLSDEYVYPLIDYGNYLDDSPYLTPGTNNVPNNNIFTELEDWYPSFFVYPIIVKIFNDIGYKFLGEYIRSSDLINLILPFVGESLGVSVSDADVSIDSKAERSQVNQQGLYTAVASQLASTFVSPILMDSIVSDPANNYNISTNVYTVPDTTSYTVTISANLIVYEMKNILGFPNHSNFYIQKQSTDGSVVDFVIGESFDMNDFITVGAFSLQIINGSESINATKGDTFKLMIKTEYLFGSWTSFTFSGFINIDQKLIQRQGGTIQHKNVIPDIKKLDLLKDVISKGNYRIVTDTLSKTVDFIPESAFFSNSAKDWTGKKDNSKGINISLIRNDGAKLLTWGYSNDSSDEFVEQRLINKDDLSIKDEEVTLESEHRKGTQSIHKSPFSSTADGYTLGLIIPKMKNETDEVIVTAVKNKAHTNYPKGSLDTGVKSTNFSPRILLWGGMKSGTFFSNGIKMTQYPYCYFTRWSGDRFTLSYADVSPSGFPGIVSRYYTQTIRSLNNSKMLKGYFWLDEYDITTLDFGRPIMVNDVQYYINKVIDYRVGGNQPTQVELISRV